MKNTYTYFDFTFDFEKRCVIQRKTVIAMTPTETNLLYSLWCYQGQTLERKQLLEMVWGTSAPLKTRTTDVHINHLRKKLQLDDYLLTVYKYGYMLVKQSIFTEKQ